MCQGSWTGILVGVLMIYTAAMNGFVFLPNAAKIEAIYNHLQIERN